MTVPSVSVALCTHNGARFVAEQVRSILAQSRPVAEIVVSDDASTDDTVAVIEQTVADWLVTRPESGLALTVLRNASPLGVTANFERALAACRGEFVALSDQDDVWHVDRIARGVEVLERRPSVLMVASDARMVDSEGAPLGRTLLETIALTAWERTSVREGRALDVLLRRNVFTGATAMLRRELVDRATPFPASWVHDEWLAIMAAALGDVDLIDEALIDYRQHGGNQIGATPLTGSGRFQRLRAPRTDRNERLLARARDLAERMPLLEPPVGAVTAARVSEKLEHELVRSALPAARLSRIRPVWHEWRTGRYTSSGLGLQDVLRDIVQPV